MWLFGVSIPRLGQAVTSLRARQPPELAPNRPEQPGEQAEDSEGQDQFNSQLVLQEPVPKFLNSVKPAHAAEVYTFLKL